MVGKYALTDTDSYKFVEVCFMVNDASFGQSSMGIWKEFVSAVLGWSCINVYYFLLIDGIFVLYFSVSLLIFCLVVLLIIEWGTEIFNSNC